jgi:hypothetical protein
MQIIQKQRKLIGGANVHELNLAGESQQPLP